MIHMIHDIVLPSIPWYNSDGSHSHDIAPRKKWNTSVHTLNQEKLMIIISRGSLPRSVTVSYTISHCFLYATEHLSSL